MKTLLCLILLTILAAASLPVATYAAEPTIVRIEMRRPVSEPVRQSRLAAVEPEQTVSGQMVIESRGQASDFWQGLTRVWIYLDEQLIHSAENATGSDVATAIFDTASVADGQYTVYCNQEDAAGHISLGSKKIRIQNENK